MRTSGSVLIWILLAILCIHPVGVWSSRDGFRVPVLINRGVITKPLLSYFGTDSILVADAAIGPHGMATKSNIVPFCLVLKVKNHRALNLIFLHPEPEISSRRDPASDELLTFYFGHVGWGSWERLTTFECYKKTACVDKFCIHIPQIDSVKFESVWDALYGIDADTHPRPLHVDSKLNGSLRSLGCIYSPGSRFSGFRSLPYNRGECGQKSPSRNSIGPCYEYVPPWHVLLGVLAFVCAVGIIVVPRRRDSGDVALTIALIFVTGLMFLVGHKCYCPDSHGNGQEELAPKREVFHHGREIVTQKDLTAYNLCNTVSGMANVLSAEKQTAIIAALAEGSSIRSIERITGVHRDTIMRLGVRVGKGCEMLLDSKMQDLGCNYLQLDEVWGFISKKERHCRVGDNPEYGDVWTFCAIDSETKLVPSFRCGKRNAETANAFVQDIGSRVRNRVQISTDALGAYGEAIEQAFGADVDYGQIVKVYVHDSAHHPERQYSAPSFASAYRRPIAGDPDMELVSTSHVERLNATTRLHVKRLSRLTLAFSKKFENFQAAVALHFAYYNFVRRHNTLRCTPAMAAGIERDFWSVSDLVEAVA